MTSDFFSEIPTLPLTEKNFDENVTKNYSELICIFFWGLNCSGCDAAKRQLLAERERVLSWTLKWFHVNAYEESDLATRFGLHGIPAFIFYRKGHKLGRITSFPGIDAFEKSILQLTAIPDKA